MKTHLSIPGLTLWLVLQMLLSTACTNNNAVHKNETSKSKALKTDNIITKQGAWCWFADPRALHYENDSKTINSTYIGYIDVHGNIKASQYNFLTKEKNEVLIRSYFQPDDHNNPSFLVLPDERIMIFYSRHTDEPCFYYRISKKPGDITSLGKEMKIETKNNTTYPSPFILSSDPDHFYLCWRGIKWHPTIARYTIPDEKDIVKTDWGPYQMVQSTAARPYCKYYSNGKDKIYLAYTTGHPDNEYPNHVYFNYIDIQTLQLKDIKGNILSEIAKGPHNINKTDYINSHQFAVVDSPADQRDWIWQTTLDKNDNPIIAMVQISKDKNEHNYYYAKWNGTKWVKTFLANGGGHFHQSEGLELCYSGGMAIDDSMPNTVYCSVPVDGTNGKVYEIVKFALNEEGKIIETEQITKNSIKNNARPFIVANSENSPLKLIWMHGNYYDWIVSSSYPKGFFTSIYGDFSFPSSKIDLSKNLMLNEEFNRSVSGTATVQDSLLITTKTTFAALKCDKQDNFTISLTLCIDEDSYEGTILKLNNLEYVLDGTSLKPYIKANEITFNSTNRLANSDSWQFENRGTGGKWWTPVKLKYFNLTITDNNNTITTYINGLIDQKLVIENVSLSNVELGGFNGKIKDCKLFNKALSQEEIIATIK